MPLPTPIPDNQCLVAQINMRGIVSSAGGEAKNALNVFYFRRTVSSIPLNVVNVEAAFQAGPVVPILAALNLRYSQTANEVRMINDCTRPFLTVPRALPGLITGDSMPVNTAIYILSRTAFRGKSFKGGKHFFPLSESDTTTATADIINAACLVRMQAIASAWLAGFTDSDGNVWVPTVLSKKNSQLQTNPTTVSTSDITQILVNQRLAKMKRHNINSVY